MSRLSKTLDQILRGGSDANVDFNDLRHLLDALGFCEHVRGSHHIFTRTEVIEIINLQPIGSKAKAYQVRQVRQLIAKYNLGGNDV
jgi:hypothetical protein